MIDVKLERRKGMFTLDMRGHADYCPGNDIVCAGASALACALTGYLAVQCGGEAVIEQESGHVRVVCPARKDLAPALDMAELGLRGLAGKYPEHVKVEG